MRVLAAITTVTALGLIAASPAAANYEQVHTFAGTPGVLQSTKGTPYERSKRWSEEVQLGGTGGMAVNYTGAGGVPAGTVYAATLYEGSPRVARFNPDGSFSENWTFEGGPPNFEGGPPNERCGPDGEPAHPVCKSRPEANAAAADVDVDQTTGYVYVFDGDILQAGKKLIHVYSADGSELIAEFGILAPFGEATAASPEKLHNTLSSQGGIAVSPGGVVYVYDVENPGNFYHRLMVFERQSPGDYEHYVYAGQGHDVAAGFGVTAINPTKPVADAAGDLYVVAGQSFNAIAEFDPSQPAAPPICEFSSPKGNIQSIAVNQLSGEVFFFSETDKKIHRLAPCKEGKFAEAGTFGIVPNRTEIWGMAFNPVRQFEPGRPAGTLYAGAPSGEGGKTETKNNESFGEPSMGYIFALPKEFPPEVISESAAHVTATTAELNAQINPKGPPTDFTFQYITEAEYEANEPADRFAGAQEAPPGGGLLGEGPAVLSAAAALSGLTPDTTYHYRAVATSHCSAEVPAKVCEGVGADQAFHTFAIEAPGLPDERVWELVSPVEKGAGEVLPVDPSITSCGSEAECKPGRYYTHFPMQSSPDGEAIVYEGTPFASSEAGPRENEYIARRDPKAGWQTTNLTPPQLQYKGKGFKAFDTTLGQGLIEQVSPTLSPEAPAEYPNLYSQPTANPLAISPLLATEPPNRLPGEGTGHLQIEYADASADLSRVFFTANDALTEETPFAPEAGDGGAAKNNLYEWERATGRLRLVNVLPGNTEAKAGASFGYPSANTISADGSRAFWSDEAGQVYVREGAETTKAIPGPGKFLSAATDGSRVLLDNGSLYDLETETSTDLTEGEGGFLGLAGQSDDLSHVYFIDTEVLDEAANEQGDVAEAGKDNLYAWAEGGAVRYVATLVAEDNGGNLSLSRAWTPLPSVRTAEASLQGRYLAFLSKAPITGYDNTGPCKGNGHGEYVSSPCPEAFLYDSATGKLRCPSCNPSGERPLGHSALSVNISEGGNFSLSQMRYLTDQGRLYFDSRDSLVPADTNDGVEDVYQYEPNEVGTCKRAAGCVSLISAGREPIDSNFLAIDERGENVFFTSRDQLVLKDHDDLIDLYDARVKGGIPAETEVARGECQGEACVAALSPPNDPTPGSSSFEGAGNVEEHKVARKHKKKKHAKRKGGKSQKRSHGRANHKRGGAK